MNQVVLDEKAKFYIEHNHKNVINLEHNEQSYSNQYFKDQIVGNKFI